VRYAPGYYEIVSRRWIVITSIAALVVAGGAFGIFKWRASHKPKLIAAVAASPAQPTDVILSGIVEARETIGVGAPMDGTLESYFVELNQEVFQGQLLGRIRNPKLDELQQRAQSDVDKAQSRVTALTGEQLAVRLEASRAQADQTRAHNDVDRLQKNYDRQKGLWAAGATARLVWEKAEKEYTDAKADAEKQDAAAQQATQREAALTRDLETANRAVADAREAVERAGKSAGAADLHSPVDGVVVARQELQGQPVDPSMKELVKIATNLTSLSVTLQNDAAASHVKPGQAVVVRVGSDDFAGTIRGTDGHIFTVDFTVPEGGKQLGQPAQVIIKY
jgi:multidrug resistance efflux pump